MTSIEFAIVSVPLVGMFFAIAETGVMILAQHALDSAVQDASRRIMTGEVQAGGMSAAQFKADICSRISGLVNCTGGLYVDVRSYSSAAPAPTKPRIGAYGSGTFDPSGFGFNPGGPSCIVVVRAALEYPAYVGLFGDALKELSNGKRIMMSTASFRNEPYVVSGPAPAC